MMTPNQIRDIAWAIDPEAKASGGSWLLRCPCHDDNSPSFLIGPGTTRDLSLKCFAGCEPADILRELSRRGLIETGKNGGGPRTEAELREMEDRAREARIAKRREDEKAAEAARELWAKGQPIAGTLAEIYLEVHRGLKPPFPPCLRYRLDTRRKVPRHSMLAAATTADGTVVAVQETFLDGAGRKAAVRVPRITEGRMLGGAAVRLAPGDRDVLAIAEGTETALAVWGRGVPCWAALGGVNMGKVEIPENVKVVIIAGDGDETGEKHAHNAAVAIKQRHPLKRVTIVRPEGNFDWADFGVDFPELPGILAGGRLKA